MMTANVKRWQVCAAMAVLLLCAASLLFTSRKESRWHVSLDARSWRIYRSESVEFDPMGTRLRSIKGYHLGPVLISSERGRTDSKVSASFAPNGTSILRRTSSTATLTRKITLVETVEVHAAGRREPGTSTAPAK